jgi:large subunit ribosomal protein L40e
MWARQIFVTCLAGTTLALDVDPAASIATIKQQISQHEDACALPVDQQRLIYAGMQLADDRTLSDYHIPQHATLHLVLRLRGGVTNIYNYVAMQLPAKIWRDQRVRQTVAREELKRKAIKSLVMNQRLDVRVRMAGMTNHRGVCVCVCVCVCV